MKTLEEEWKQGLESAKTRFFTKVYKSDSGCWEWTSWVQPTGYGQFHFMGQGVRAHRYAYMAFKGEIPNGMDVCHTCDNRKCVNPDHLFLGSRRENMRDCISKGRLHPGWVPGEKNGSAKLTWESVNRIRDMYSSGNSCTTIAKLMGVSKTTVSRIVRRITWRNA